MGKKININIFLIILLLINPFIDILTAISVRNIDITFSIGIIIRFSLVLLLFINYYFWGEGYKNKKFNIFLVSIFSLVLLYTFHFYLINSDLLFVGRNLTELFKILYLPAFLILIYFSLGKEKIKNIDKYVVLSILLYCLLIIIPFITNTSFLSYAHSKVGTVGWFYSANEIGNIIAISLPLLFKYCLDRRNRFLYKLITTIVVIVAILIMGTKTPIIALFLTIFGYLIYYMLKSVKERKNVGKVLIGVISVIAFVFIIPFTPFYDNLKIHLEYLDITSSTELINNPETFNHFFLGERITFLSDTTDIYNSSNIRTKALGIGYLEPYTNQEYKTVEMDFADILFRNGILLFLIIFLILPIIYFKGIRFSKKNAIYLMMLLLALLISSIVGHVLVSPAVGLYVLIILLSLKKQEHIELKNKISILSLHMGYGGIEKTIVTQANMLSKNYETEIICLYKLDNTIPYELNDKVKLIYLSRFKPNKKEFMDAVNNKRIINVLKEGIKATFILFKKYSLIKKHIYSSNAKIIISTRIEFTKLLNNYGNPNATLIAEEHAHHRNDKKYIRELKKSLKNIDYLLPTSQYLTDDYKVLFKNNTNVKYIPNALEYIPQHPNKCDNLNIISVGRFAPEKGFSDLIEIFSMINKENPKITLTLVGDGSEMPKIKELISKLNLKDKVILKGFLNQIELRKEYKKASLYLMTSYEESFGIVLLEAMSYGIPCFAFDDALGAKEIINDKNGMLIKNRHKEEMIKEVIKYFKENKDSYIKNARITAEFYSITNIEKIWLEFIEKL